MMPDDPRAGPIAWVPVVLAFTLVGGCDGPPPALGPQGALKGHAREVVALAFAPDGKTLASRSADAVKVWDVDRRRELRSFPSDGSDFSAVAFAPDGRTIAANRAGVGAVAWDVASGDQRAVYRHAADDPAPSGPVVAYGWGLSYSPDDKTLAGGGSHGGQDGFVTLWDVVGAVSRVAISYPSPVTTVVHAPDGETIAIGSMSGNIDLYEPAGRRVKVQLRASRAYLAPVAFAPDGRTLATASDDRTVRLWDTGTGQERGALKGHRKGVFCVAFHPSGRTMASGDAGGTIFLWDLPSGQAIARLEGHRGKVWAVAFRPDGRTMASAGEDREVRLWDVSGSIADAGR